MQTKKCLLLAVTLMLAYGTSAQSGIGLRVGTNLATISEIQDISDQNLEPEHVAGLQLALFTEWGFSEHMGLQTELNYLQKGSKLTVIDEDANNIKVKVNYLELPVMAKFRFGEDRLQYFAMLGPSLGYALGGKARYTVQGEETVEDIEFDTDINDDGEKDRRWDVSGIAGAGAALAAGPGKLVMDLRYAMDFTDFVKFKDRAPANHKESYNRGLGISLGYQLPFGKS